MEYQVIDESTFVSPGSPGEKKQSDVKIVRFFKSPLNGEDYIEIKKVADADYLHTEKATAFYQGRYSEEWERYSQGMASVQVGETLLSDVAWVPDAIRRRLEGMNIFSLETLVGLPEHLSQQVGPGVGRLQLRAKQTIDEKKRLAGIEDENIELRERVAGLEEFINEFRAKQKAEETPSPTPKAQPVATTQKK